MTTRWKLWVGASALAMTTGVLPATPILSPITTAVLGVDLANEASAQESGEGEEGAPTECTTESGEGDEGGETECAPPSTEEGEGEG
jgi:hypothetical protein